jgi:P-type Ca2+ transporter type 2C
MMVRAVWTADGAWEVTGDGYRPAGEFLREGDPAAPDESLRQALLAGTLCSNATLAGTGARSDPYRVHGDPTEGALVVAAAKASLEPEVWQRLGEVPFESERRRMSVVVRHRKSGEVSAIMKGAPDAVLSHCTHVLAGGRLAPLTAERRAAILAENERMAAGALRVLGIALRPVAGGKAEVSIASAGQTPEATVLWEREMVFLALVGLIDPPRPEVKAAVTAARRAGIATVMITGDHQATARAIASELGILRAQDGTLTGSAMDRLTDRELTRLAGEVRVFARVTPQHKLRIVRAFRERGEIVAMTGDGVNDAPAVKEADIGVAMGRTGTDVTKEASSMVLADDNYATIVAAVEEGRGIYDNIRKFIRYLLSCNTGEVLVMFLATVMRLPLPLLPGQILLVNLVTDGLPAMALGVDPPDPDVMRRPPRSPSEGPFARGLAAKILGRGVLIGLATLATFIWGLWPAGFADPATLVKARTLALSTLVLSQLFHVFDCRSETRSIWEVGLFSNRWLVAAVLTSVATLLAAIYWEPLAAVFRTVPLSPADWAVVLLAAGAGQITDVLRLHLFG